MKPKPCPLCGNNDLYIGTMSAHTQGVQCMFQNEKGQIKGCRLKIERTYPETFPKYTENLPLEKALGLIRQRTLLKAIKAWNKRTT